MKCQCHQCARLEKSDILGDLNSHLSHLSDQQRCDVVQFIFSIVPSCTTVLHHDINVGDAAPIMQHSYRVNSVKWNVMNSEVEYLLKHGFAKPSCSPWSSPYLLVPKSDGTARFCTDYPKVNAVTVPDCFFYCHEWKTVWTILAQLDMSVS